MLETSARLLRLLSLLQSRRDFDGAELAGRLGVGLRTVRRDIDRLRDLGYPVDATPGTAGGYRLGVGAVLPPLLLDDEEAVAVAISLHTATTSSVAGLEEGSLRALTKLQRHAAVPAPAPDHRLPRHHGPAGRAGFQPDQVDPERLTAIAAACRDQRRLRLKYAGRAGVGTRDVEPHRLVHTPRRWYLLAWDVDRGDWRTFRVDRIQGPRARPGLVSFRASYPRMTWPPTWRSPLRRLPTAIRPAFSSVLRWLPSRAAPRRPPGGWKPWTSTAVSCTRDPTRSKRSPFTWPSRASTSRSSTPPELIPVLRTLSARLRQAARRTLTTTAVAHLRPDPDPAIPPLRNASHQTTLPTPWG